MKRQFQNKSSVCKLQVVELYACARTCDGCVCIQIAAANTRNNTNGHRSHGTHCVFLDDYRKTRATEIKSFHFFRLYLLSCRHKDTNLPTLANERESKRENNVCKLYIIGHFNKNKILFFFSVYLTNWCLLSNWNPLRKIIVSHFANEHQFYTHLLCLFCTHAPFPHLRHWILYGISLIGVTGI